MRVPFIAGNWKMNTTVEEGIKLVQEMKGDLDRIEGVEKAICPPFISLLAIRDLVAGSSIGLGAQNVYFEEKGAYTGEISPNMLAGLCTYVIIGHSERRQYFGETDESVNKKVKAAIKVGLKPIMCVGESLEQEEAGLTEQVVNSQVKKGLAEIDKPESLVVAYEPIWAIGTGKAATGERANATIGLIRENLAHIYGKDFAESIRIQYGGSVTAANVTEFMSQPEIDGALVGGASLKPGEFVTIVAHTAA